MRSYRDFLSPKLDPTTGKPVFPLSFSDRANIAQADDKVVPIKRRRGE